MIFLSVEGGIAVGKSCVINWLKKQDFLTIGGIDIYREDILFIDEPLVDMTQFWGFFHKSGSQNHVKPLCFNPLAEMMQNTLASQIVITQAFIKHYNYLKPSFKNYKLIISERSWISSYIFSETLKNIGLLTQFEFEVLNKFHLTLFNTIEIPNINHILFLHSPAEISIERIKERQRPGEIETITKSYLQELEKSHTKMLCHNTHPNFPKFGLGLVENKAESDILFKKVAEVLIDIRSE